MTKHIQSESEKNTHSRSQRMIDAGFKRRDNRETCDDCGALVSAQLLPVHECKSAAEKRVKMSELLEAAKALHDDIAEYQRINHLGGYDNHNMKRIRAAIAAAESAAELRKIAGKM